ncbi:MAG: diaminopimelate epimerase, partial [Planctomycetes bacterium]|nr:diaminopimelate epimerase [Planctomycetota bacterium]
MRVEFTKMEGLGNDFVVVDNLAGALAVDTRLARRLADRRRGVGCDQLLVAERPTNGSAQVRMRIYNTDGSEAGQCGNGLRCFSVFVRERGVGAGDEELVVETAGGLVRARPAPDGTVSVDMGVPRFAAAEVPLDAARAEALGTCRHAAAVVGER